MKKFYKADSKSKSLGAFLGLLILAGVFGFLSPSFASPDNIANIFAQVSPIAFVAAGMAFVVLAGSIDLSVGSIAGLAGIVFALLCQADVPWGVSLALAIIGGGITGLVNGLLFAGWGLPSFIATLGMMGVARGAALWLTEGRVISDLPATWVDFVNLNIWGLPLVGILWVLVFLMAQLWLKRTAAGRQLIATGCNPTGSWLCGVPVRAYRVWVFVISGLLSAIAGLVLAGRLNSAHPLSGNLYEIDAIAAVVIGGGSLSGGRVSFWGTLCGVLILGVLRNAMSLLNVGSYAQQVLVGLIVIAAVALDRYKQGKGDLNVR